MAPSKHLELLTQNINKTLLLRKTRVEDFLIKLQEKIFHKIEKAVLQAMDTAPLGAKKLIIRISNFDIHSSEDKEENTVMVTCNSYFSDNDITLKDNVVLGIEKTYTFTLFTHNVTMYNSISNVSEAKPEEIEYFRFYLEDFYVNIRPTEIFPDGFMWAIPLEI